MSEEKKNLTEQEGAEAAAANTPPAPAAEREQTTLGASNTVFPTVKPRRTALKRQRLAVLITLGVVLVLAVAMVLVWQFTSKNLVTFPDGSAVEDTDGMRYYTVKKDGVWVMVNKEGDLCEITSEGLYKTKDQALIHVDKETGEFTVVAAVLLSGTEDRYFNAIDGSFDILLYPMLERKDIQSIEIKNSKDHITFVYDKAYDDFVIKGHEKAPYDSVMFSTLLSLTGYTNTVMRLDLSPENPDAEGFRQNGYAEYGLPDNPDDAENYFIITDKSGNTHKVIIGNIILDDTGYYARYAGRDDVYILQQLSESEYNSTLSGTLLCTLEDYVTPTVTATIGSSNYFDVTDFTIWAADGSTTSTDLSTFTQLVKFSYEPIELRKDTFYSNIPYFGQGKLEGYAVDEYQADVCLQSIMDMLPTRTVKVYDDYEDTEANLEDFIKTYGAAYAIEFIFNAKRNGADGNYTAIKEEQITHQIWISPQVKKDNGEIVYYMFNEMFNMIVETGRQHLGFLEWTDIDWVDHSVFKGNISYLDKMEVSIKGGTTAGITGVQHILFDLEYVDNNENKVESTSTSGNIKVYASYNGNTTLLQTGKDKKNPKDIAFNLLYQTLLASNLEDAMPSGSEALQESLKATEPDLAITLTFVVDGKEEVRTYRFYSKTAQAGRGAFVTVNGVGGFYMQQYRVDKIINDMGRVLSSDPNVVIDPVAKN